MNDEAVFDNEMSSVVKREAEYYIFHDMTNKDARAVWSVPLLFSD